MEKRYVLLSIIVDLLMIGLIPLNLFVLSIPEWVMIVVAVILVGILVLFYMKGNGRWISKVLLSLLTIVSCITVLFGSYCNPYWNSVMFRGGPDTLVYDTEITYEEAKADIDCAMQDLRKTHPAFQNGIPMEVEQEYQNVMTQLQAAETIDVALVKQKLQQILSVLGDGHTCSYTVFQQYHYLKDIYPRSQENWQLVQVNGMTLEQLLEEYNSLYCYEVESWGIHMLKQDLSTLEGLTFLKIPMENGIDYTYESPQGLQETVTYYAEDYVTYEEYMALNQISESEDTPFVSYSIDEDRSLALLTLTSCQYNEVYRNCLKEMFTEVQEKGIQHVAVDIRDNGGGNSLVVNEFIRYLETESYQVETSVWRLGCFRLPLGRGTVQNKKYTDLTFSGDVYVLTSVGSFSSAMMFAEYMKDNQLGTIIGEAPGNTPSGYGDISVFRLPNTGLFMQVSTKEFYRADTDTQELLVEPDIECDADDALEILYQQL